LAVDHDWWWPGDSEKLSQAMTEMGWYSFEDLEFDEGLQA